MLLWREKCRKKRDFEIPESELAHFGSYYVRDGEFDFEWHMFLTTLPTRPRIQIEPYEDHDFRWVTPKEALQLPLVHDQARSIKLFFE